MHRFTGRANSPYTRSPSAGRSGNVFSGKSSGRDAAPVSAATIAAAYFAAMPTQPSDYWKNIATQAISDLVSAGIFQKLDGGLFLAAPTAGQACIDFVNPARAASEVNLGGALNFAPGFGYTGDAGGNNWLDTGYNPTANGVRWTQNAAHMAVWSNTSAVSDGYEIATVGGDASIISRGTGDLVSAKIDGTGISNTSTDGAGLFSINRSGASAQAVFINGASTYTNGADPSSALPNATLGLFGDGSLASSTHQLGFACWGGSLTAGEHAALYTIISTAMRRMQVHDVAADYFGLLSSAPVAFQLAYEDFRGGLDAAGITSKLDGGNILANADAASAGVDFIRGTSVTYAPSWSGVFTAYRGITGTNKASGTQTDYVDTGFTPSTAGGVMTQNSTHYAAYFNSNTQSNNPDWGANGTWDAFLTARNGSNQSSTRVNDSTSNTISGVTNGVGTQIVSRTAGANYVVYKDGASIGTITQASGGLPNATIRYLQVQGSSSTNRQMSFACWGSGLTAGEVATLHTLIAALMATILAL